MFGVGMGASRGQMALPTWGNGRMTKCRDAEHCKTYSETMVRMYATDRALHRFTYEGEVTNGQRHGHGKCEYKDGRVYEGSFCVDKIEGEGSLSIPCVGTDSGQFSDGKLHGKGQRDWTNLYFYEVRRTPSARVRAAECAT